MGVIPRRAVSPKGGVTSKVWDYINKNKLRGLAKN
jgi:hypothetical protein